jgi:broad specificity phosphatase PhoE
MGNKVGLARHGEYDESQRITGRLTPFGLAQIADIGEQLVKPARIYHGELVRLAESAGVLKGKFDARAGGAVPVECVRWLNDGEAAWERLSGKPDPSPIVCVASEATINYIMTRLTDDDRYVFGDVPMGFGQTYVAERKVATPVNWEDTENNQILKLLPRVLRT